MNSPPYPPQLFISTYKQLKAFVVDDHRSNVSKENETAFGELAVHIALSCNRAIAATESNNTKELRGHLDSLLRAVRNMASVFMNKEPQKVLESFEAAIESHLAQES